MTVHTFWRFAQLSFFGSSLDPIQRAQAARTAPQALRALSRLDTVAPEALRLAQAVVRGGLATHPVTRVRQEVLHLAAAALALRQPVQVLCRSGQAAHKQHEAGRALFERLGLTSAAIGEADDQDRRIAAYAKRIVFAASDRIAQDHLRDQVQALGCGKLYRAPVARLARTSADPRQMMPSAAVALVDDADLILMALSRPVNLASEREIDTGRRLAEEAFEALQTLVAGLDYMTDPLIGRITLTTEGERRLATYAALFRGPWSNADWRRRTVFSALTIRDSFLKGRDYTLDDTGITLFKPTGIAAEAPSIPDLIAAKERLTNAPRQLHTIDVRRLLPRFRQVGGVGFDLHRFARELSEVASLKVVGKAGHSLPPLATLHKDRAAWAEAVGDAAQHGVLVWAATDADAEALQALSLPVSCVTGMAILDAERPFRLVQAGGAPRALTGRVAEAWPDLEWKVEVSCEDGFLALLPPDHSAAKALAERRSAGAYLRALAAAEKVADEQRLRRAQSEAYFDRILDFLEPVS